jgi:two-component system cell cycle sensor histidine kinase/response regulator CckA
MKLTSEPSNPRLSALHHPVILVVDDEPLIRELLVIMLRMRGYKVLSAESGAEALAMARLEHDTIDVLVTDLCMPGMSGPELAAELHDLRPETKTIFVSGYSLAEMMTMGLQVPEAFCLPKPLQAGALDKAIQAALEPTPAFR